MAGRGVPGSAPDTGKREWFARLIAEGANNSEACRIVGIARKTGTRWRYGRVVVGPGGRERHYAPVVAVGAGVGAGGGEISPRYLSERERIDIADLHRAGAGVREIARELRRSPSTISRELRRNADPASGRYGPHAAHLRAAGRRARPRPGKIVADPVLREFIAGRLMKRWSPEQVVQALRREFPEEPARHLCVETIYQAIYRRGPGEPGWELPRRVLRTGRRCRRGRRRRGERCARPESMTPVSQRPAGATDRSESGHWEGDLITGEHNRSAIGTLVERVSRFTILVYLPGRHTAGEVRDALIAAMSALPPALRRSLTWDQGKEMALHRDISAGLGMPVYFCDPHSPWQRPSNENTNGLLRQYFPKGTDLRAHSREELGQVAAELNARPRKTLGWDTPAARLATAAGPDQTGLRRRHRRAGR